MDASAIFAILGGIALLVALFGGGIKAEKIEIPTVSGKNRVLSGIVGISLLSISIWLSSPTTKHQTSSTMPQETQMATQSIVTNSVSSLGELTVLDNFDGEKFNEQNWFFDWISDKLTYTITQSDGKACFQFISPSAQEIPIRSQFPGTINIIEADVFILSGEGSFGIDIWDEFEWNNLLMDSDGNFKIIYTTFENSDEVVYEVPNVECCSGFHTLAVKYNGSLISYYYDGTQVFSRPSANFPLGYGLDVRTDARSNLNVCVDEIRVQFKK